MDGAVMFSPWGPKNLRVYAKQFGGLPYNHAQPNPAAGSSPAGSSVR
jgi:hypothetical protein